VPNRLAQESSPYLRQHQNNPVDWFPWGDEAFAKAAAEDKPIFLSVGYSSCHWCHVMVHESFEDAEVANLLNLHFVSIKVDREERPDVDEVYMTAVQLTSGRGGWPMSAFLTPDRRPFFSGTYFPKEDRQGHPGFLTVLRQIVQAWATRREDLERGADQVADLLRQTRSKQPPETTDRFDQGFLDKVVADILQDFDPESGGFGPAPKFPPHTGIELLLTYATATAGPIEIREAAIEAAMITLQRMVFGGIHDHVGGGFHRYSTDAEWVLPHFEKMLYDNALMLGNLARASQIADKVMPELGERFRAAAAGIVDWLGREMRSPEGLFFSALDADSEGEEGKHYVWREAEVREILGARADAFLLAYNFSPEGNFADEATHQKTGQNIPFLTADHGGAFDEDLEALLFRRDSRVRPGLDDKAIVAGNGLAMIAFSEVGLVPMAAATAEVILAAEAEHGRLPHQITKSVPSGDAFLDDYACFTDALFRIAGIAEAFEAEGEPFALPRPWESYREEATRLAEEMIARFYDASSGGFFLTAEGGEDLFGRSKPVFDQPVPSGNAVALRVLLGLGDAARAAQTVGGLMGWMARAPQATESLIGAALDFALGFGPEQEMMLESEIEVAVTPVPVPVSEVRVQLSSREIVAGSDGKGSVEVILTVPEGLHLNSNEPPARWLVPTRVEVRPLKASVSYPVAVNDRFEDVVKIGVAIELPKGERAVEFELKVSYQACTDSECQAPVEKMFDGVLLAP